MEGVRPTLAQVIDGEEWAKHNFSRVPMCCAIGCGKPATWGAIADNAPPTPDNIGETHACDDHLVEIGLTTYVDHPASKHWRVWVIGVEPPHLTGVAPAPSAGSGGYELVELAPAPVPVA